MDIKQTLYVWSTALRKQPRMWQWLCTNYTSVHCSGCGQVDDLWTYLFAAAYDLSNTDTHSQLVSVYIWQSCNCRNWGAQPHSDHVSVWCCTVIHVEWRALLLKEQADVADAIHSIRSILGTGGFSRLGVEYVILVTYIFLYIKTWCCWKYYTTQCRKGHLYPVIFWPNSSEDKIIADLFWKKKQMMANYWNRISEIRESSIWGLVAGDLPSICLLWSSTPQKLTNCSSKVAALSPN